LAKGAKYKTIILYLVNRFNDAFVSLTAAQRMRYHKRVRYN